MLTWGRDFFGFLGIIISFLLAGGIARLLAVILKIKLDETTPFWTNVIFLSLLLFLATIFIRIFMRYF
ncbi:MAG: hypothetical protein AAB110_04815 [Candidatus Desantisbacteria bacterium]